MNIRNQKPVFVFVILVPKLSSHLAAVSDEFEFADKVGLSFDRLVFLPLISNLNFNGFSLRSVLNQFNFIILI